ncbi:MAG: aminotransferase class IV [Gammaproteobacteria bacterium]
MKIKLLDDQQIFKNLSAQANPFFEQYYAFYSSWYGGISKNPHLMLLPIDDHMVHRGDGVFEAMKAINRSVYLLDEHLQRLLRSAKTIGLTPTISLAEMKQIIIETLQAANQDDVIIRTFLSRGPGNFSVNPYDSVDSQFYVVITKLNSPTIEKYTQGVVIGKSAIPVKDSWMTQVKSCNYLPNVMMKKEAADRDLDFVISVDENGFLGESATENIMIVDQSGTIVHPELNHILKGLTMTRACELAREHGMPTEVRPMTLEDLQSAREAMMCGTSVDIIPVSQFENRHIANGKPGPIAKKLLDLIIEDIASGPYRTGF